MTLGVSLAALLFSVSVAQASEALLRDFAGCTGRLSAAMEHAWLVSAPEADTLQDMRGTFVTLLDAVVPAGRERDALTMRVEAKMAFARLLTVSTFGSDAALAERAERRADEQIRQCARLILQS